jgi:hypothetical protein
VDAQAGGGGCQTGPQSTWHGSGACRDKSDVSIGVIIAGFAAASALVVWHWIATTKQISDELLKEYQRLLTEARDREFPNETGE